MNRVRQPTLQMPTDLDAGRTGRGADGRLRAAWAGVVGLGLLALSGCASLPGDPSKMTPEQLKANAKDRNSTAACSNGKTAAGNVTLIYVNADQGTRLGSTVNIKADCETTITTLYTAADIAAAVKAAASAAEKSNP